jgi:hypothetical protein
MQLLPFWLPGFTNQTLPVGKRHQFGLTSQQPQQQTAPPRASAAGQPLLPPAARGRLEPAFGQRPSAMLCAAKGLNCLPGNTHHEHASAVLQAGCGSKRRPVVDMHKAVPHLVAAAAARCSELDAFSRRPAASSCSRCTSASRLEASDFNEASSADRLHAVRTCVESAVEGIQCIAAYLTCRLQHDTSARLHR